ncbi:MAG: hypothetical protein Q8L88_13140 [Bacteroidota bacterium]|nr:hypothetical protein [Bacteroidota bacterium]
MKLVAFLICDDIRTETGNKHSIIGVYDDIIQFEVKEGQKNVWPKQMKLGVYARIIFEENDKAKNLDSIKFRLNYNGEIINMGEGPFNSKEAFAANRMNFVFINPFFNFKGIGEMIFSIEFYDKKNNLIDAMGPEFKIKITEKNI